MRVTKEGVARLGARTWRSASVARGKPRPSEAHRDSGEIAVRENNRAKRGRAVREKIL